MRGARTTKTMTFQATQDSTTRRNAALYLSGMLAKPMLRQTVNAKNMYGRQRGGPDKRIDEY